ncbi:MAG: aromatic ring-hydroxylating dioxygenase subunit alpha [Gammaproteobacteria bacterium]|nr:aromatic ring-hydroxylating dioxygenase subunit alpha [Gammaproteobacteria bacterium]MCP4089526.1 aromatic ring-hydroxylating dioxygenase subunit alpha [Gammaproteobacteria bacterium]MCP4276232.1 aromatic ring-hydroxylating dioxygenase subunit alpha [Gammaproteobacteria bacterium]MCP4832929.1 aromatic ring-hydroxylating dioxygenase subunit alpha [Gammaproteobacteria bacterium]MCP4930054.1 aromatic ring-hydroxylating dioxygenase subunit alpha [Gammaproteobacteria bacterium]
MYINFWYPIALSDEVTNESPVKVEIMGMNFVAFRDTKANAHVISNTCIHRGGALGNGMIKDDCIVCPYHGWEFAGDGKCTNIPTLPQDKKTPARAKVDSYPTEERYGILFAFLGDLPADERPPIFDISEYGQEGWRANKVVVFEVNAYYQRSVENGLDGAHNEFVHPLQGAPSIIETLRVRPLEVDDVPPWGSEFMYPASGSTSAETKLIGAGEGETWAGSAHHGPNTLITRIIFSETKAFRQYFFEAPINDGRTRIFFVNMRCFMMEPENDQRLIDVNMRIADEDINIIEALDPVRTPFSTAKELLTPVDKPIFRYRDYLKEWDNKGWRIDWKKLQELKGDVAFTIACPTRRTEKNWILDIVPLVAGE